VKSSHHENQKLIVNEKELKYELEANLVRIKSDQLQLQSYKTAVEDLKQNINKEVNQKSQLTEKIKRLEEVCDLKEEIIKKIHLEATERMRNQKELEACIRKIKADVDVLNSEKSELEVIHI